MTYDELTPAERDRLRAAYDAGFSAGSCGRSFVPPELLDLMDAVQDDWFASLETMQATRPAWPAYAPEWLRAAAERKTALGDARPMEECDG